MITLDAARAALLAGVGPLSPEDVAIDAAGGRVLAQALLATADLPAEPRSAMDGYAVREEDASVGARLVVSGEAYAGSPFAGRVEAGQAVRIATGGVVPNGASRVLMQEIVRRDGDRITVEGQLPEAMFIRPAGGDFRTGDVLLDAGNVVGAAALGLAIASGTDGLSVRRRPRAALFTSGDELRAGGQALGAGDVHDSAGPTLAALIARWGAVPLHQDILPDDHDAARAMIGHAAEADILVFVGGASVGDRDVLRGVIADLGATMVFDRIAVQPGKPCWHARFGDGRLLLGLPGNPASAFVCAHLLLEPLIAALAGRASSCTTAPARLASALPAPGDREIWWRATMTIDAGGQRIVTPDPRRDSSLQRPLAEANALLRQPAGAALPAGAVVEVLAL